MADSVSEDVQNTDLRTEDPHPATAPATALMAEWAELRADGRRSATSAGADPTSGESDLRAKIWATVDVSGAEEEPEPVAEEESVGEEAPEAVPDAEEEPEPVIEEESVGEEAPEAVSGAEGGPDAEEKPEPVVEEEFVGEEAPEAVSDAEGEPDAEAESEPDAEEEPEAESEPDAAPDTEPDAEPEPEAESEPDAEEEPEAASEPDAAPDAAPDAESDAEPEPEAEPEAEPEPIAEEGPEPECVAKDSKRDAGENAGNGREALGVERDFKMALKAAPQSRPARASSLRLSGKSRPQASNFYGRSSAPQRATEARANHKAMLDAMLEHVGDLRANRIKSLDGGGYLQELLDLMRLIERVGYPRIYDVGDRTMKYYAEVCELEPCGHPDLARAINGAIQVWWQWNLNPDSSQTREEFSRALWGTDVVIKGLTERAVADLDGGALESALNLMAEMHRAGYPRIHDKEDRTFASINADIEVNRGRYDEVLWALLEKTRAAWADWSAGV